MQKKHEKSLKSYKKPELKKHKKIKARPAEIFSSVTTATFCKAIINPK